MPNFQVMLPPNARDQVLAEHHRAFFNFLRPRVESDAVAEDILQEAYTRTLPKLSDVRDDESVVAWFYRILRNATVDHYRRTTVEKSARTRLEGEAESSFEPELKRNLCACMNAVLPSLKPEYADIVGAVDLGERSIAEVAIEKGLTANNATVRLHRARAALRRRLVEVCGACSDHGCLDCSCRQPKP